MPGAFSLRTGLSPETATQVIRDFIPPFGVALKRALRFSATKKPTSRGRLDWAPNASLDAQPIAVLLQGLDPDTLDLQQIVHR